MPGPAFRQRKVLDAAVELDEVERKLVVVHVGVGGQHFGEQCVRLLLPPARSEAERRDSKNVRCNLCVGSAFSQPRERLLRVRRCVRDPPAGEQRLGAGREDRPELVAERGPVTGEECIRFG